jgi:hypothetical protein
MAGRSRIEGGERRISRALRAGAAATLGLTLTVVNASAASAPAPEPDDPLPPAEFVAAALPAAPVPDPAPQAAPAPTPAVPAPPVPAPPVPAAPEVEQVPGLPSLLQVAQGEVGGSEDRYTTGWGFASGFWCAKFVSWALAHAGIDLREDGPGDFRFVVEDVAGPAPGDLVFIDLIPEQRTGQPTHIGIVEAVNADGSVVAIEGNADDSGLVTRQVRTADEIIGFGRPPAPTSTTVIPAPERGPEADCIWIEIGKPWLCDWEP